MLDGLLRILAQGGAHTYADLARGVGVSEDLLRQGIEDLARMGYLKELGAGCHGKCRDCAVAGVCAVAGRGRVWTLTEKGSQVARELR